MISQEFGTNPDGEDDLSTIELDKMSATKMVEILDKLYPHRCPRPGESLESIHRYAGRRAMIDELIGAVEQS